MAECSKCGKQSMSFTCRYCGKKFCSSHRLPEKHDCEKLEEGIEQEKEETEKWFQEKDVREDLKPSEPPQPSLIRDALDSLKNNATLSIIILTSLIYFLQPALPGITPPIEIQQVELILQNPLSLNPMVLYPSLEYMLQRPWSLFTLMFLHAGFFHLFANMVTFYFFGRPMERLVSTVEFLKFYFGTGIIASIGFIAFRNFLVYGLGQPAASTFGPAVGASGAVVAMFSAVAMLYPDAEVLLYFFIPMRIKTALHLFAGIEVIGLTAKMLMIPIPILQNLAASAHLTGLIVGIWYGKRLRDNYNTKTGVLDLLG